MNYAPKMNRRAFLVTAAAAGGGLALGLDLPLGGGQIARAQDGSPEIGVWVVIRPDETVVVRVVRSEMGQGTITGLAQLVAEELECDWSKVAVEYPTPGQSVARKRPWGAFSTGGSRDDEGAAIHFRNIIHDCLLHAFAAMWIASRTCWKVPQRQILVIAALMSASVGFGFSLSSAATAMTIPLWQ